MKARKLLTLSTMVIASIFHISAQVQTKTAESNPELSHWSFAFKTGLDYFRVAPVGDTYIGNGGWILPGLVLEYTKNPYFGMGLDLSYLTYNRSTAKGHTLDLTAFASANLSNLLIPERTGFWSKVSFYGILGAGAGRYYYDLYDGSNTGHSFSPVITTALLAELKLSDKWGLGFEGQYRSYIREDLGGAALSQLSSDAFTATVSLRYKFGSKQHARNVSVQDYYPMPAPVIIEKPVENATADKADLERLKTVEEQNAALKSQLDKLEKDLNELKSKNDNSPSTTSTTFQNIEFESESEILTESSYKTLDMIAEVLKKSGNNLKLNIAGHTDNSGSRAFNQTLSEKRAEVVKQYLLSKGAPNTNITTTGYGELQPIATNDTDEGKAKNRRVDFSFSKE